MKSILLKIFSRFSTDLASIILLGFILRLIIAPFTLHWDLYTNTRIAAKLFQLTPSEFYREPLAVFPPLMYWFLFGMISIVKPFLGGSFDYWLHLNDLSAITFPFLYRFLFFLKLPMIFLEIFTAIIFSRLVEPSNQKKLLLLWMIHPLPLYLISGWTNVDIIPLFFILLSFYFLKKTRPIKSSLCLGIAAAFKLFPLFFFPFLLFYLKTWKQRIYVFIVFLVPIIITHWSVLTLPEYLKHAVTGGYSEKILYSILPIGHNRALVYFYLFYFFTFLHFISKEVTYMRYIMYCFFSIAPLFIFSAFNLQWFLWLFPFLLFYQIGLPKIKTVIFFFYLSYFCLVLLSQASLNIGIFVPLEPTLWKFDWPLRTLIGEKHLYSIMNSIHSLFAVLLVWLIYHVYREGVNISR